MFENSELHRKSDSWKLKQASFITIFFKYVFLIGQWNAMTGNDYRWTTIPKK